VDVANSKCNPWTISSPRAGTNPDPNSLEWSPQITAPMPLDALYSLMKENAQDLPEAERNILDGDPIRGNQLVLVTQDYFQSNKNGIDKSKVTDDVLAFCSLVLSYGKLPSKVSTKSPKLYTAFMPRTEFNTIYQQVRSKIPGDLFTLFDSLACYTTEEGDDTVM